MKSFYIKSKFERISDADGHWNVATGYTKSGQFEEALWGIWEQVTDVFSLEVYSHRQHIQLIVTAEEGTSESVKASLQHMLPTAELINFPDPMKLVKEDDLIITTEYGLKRMSLLPFRTFKNLGHDPIAPLLNVMSQFPYDQKVFVQWVVRKIKDNWKHHLGVKIMKYQWLSSFPFDPLHWFRPKVLERFCESKTKILMPPFAVNLRTAVVAGPPENPDDKREIARIKGEMEQSTVCIFHGLRYTHRSLMGEYQIKKIREGYKAFQPLLERKQKKPFWLSRQELATQWHPIEVNLILNLDEVISSKTPPPAQLSAKVDPSTTSLFARTQFRESNIHFGLHREDRRSHIHIVGKSGMGKSKLIQLLAKSDIESGYGLALIDCHGDLVDELLQLVPESRIHDVALIDISDYSHPPCFNPFARVREESRSYMAEEFLHTLKRVGKLTLKEDHDRLVTEALKAIMDAPDTTALSLLKILSDKEYRTLISGSLTNGRDYWVEKKDEIDLLIESEEIQGIIRMLSHLLSSDMVSFVMGQNDNAFNFLDMIEENKIILVKVPKKNLGRQASVLLGSLALSLLNVAAAERFTEGIKGEHDDFYIYIDEFQNFASPAVTRAITNGASNQICYTIAHQSIQQISAAVYEDLTSNVGNLIAFQVGAADAKALEPKLSPPFDASDLVNLDARSFCIRMLMKGQLKEAFTGRTDDVEYPVGHFAEKILYSSRLQYAKERIDAAEGVYKSFCV